MASTYSGSAAGGSLASQVSVNVPSDGDPLNAASVAAGLQKAADYLEAIRTTGAFQAAAAPLVVSCVILGAPVASTTYYGGPGWCVDKGSFFASAIGPAPRMPFAGKMSLLRTDVHQGNMGGGNCAITVYKNLVATALTCTIASGASTASDLTHSFTFVAGDQIVFAFAFGSGVTSAGGTPQGIGAYAQITLA